MYVSVWLWRCILSTPVQKGPRRLATVDCLELSAKQSKLVTFIELALYCKSNLSV